MTLGELKQLLWEYEQALVLIEAFNAIASSKDGWVLSFNGGVSLPVESQYAVPIVRAHLSALKAEAAALADRLGLVQ